MIEWKSSGVDCSSTMRVVRSDNATTINAVTAAEDEDATAAEAGHWREAGGGEDEDGDDDQRTSPSLSHYSSSCQYSHYSISCASVVVNSHHFSSSPPPPHLLRLLIILVLSSTESSPNRSSSFSLSSLISECRIQHVALSFFEHLSFFPLVGEITIVILILSRSLVAVVSLN